MRPLRASAVVLLAGLWLPTFCGCTKNPFGEDDISSGSRQVRGSVQVADAQSSEGVYVWLEGFDLGTHSDASGRFQITLPPTASQGGSGAVSGIFDLYFYLANYQLATAQVVTRNGAFVYSSGDINRNGELKDTKVLHRFLRISTKVEPAVVSENYPGTITNVQVTLTAAVDSVTVVFPRSVGSTLGAVLVRHIGTQQVFIYESFPNVTTSEVATVGRAARSWSMSLNRFARPLPAADYEVFPYLLVRHEVIPGGLIASLGTRVEELGPNYLKIPFRREGGEFTVTP